MTDTNKERAEFEARYASQPDVTTEPERSYELDEAGINELIKDCIWEGWKARAAKAPAAPTQASPDGWKWMTHPSRNGGLPIPVRVFAEDGVTYYQPFSEADCEFEWESRDSEWHEAAPPAPTEQWRDIETAPKDVLVMVYTPPQVGDWPDTDRINFDYICPDYEDWRDHCESREHYLAVGGASACGPDVVCTGPGEKAPYTHWMPIPAPPQGAAKE